MREVEVHRGAKVLQLLAEAVREPRESPDLHADDEVLTLDHARAHEVKFRVTDPVILFDTHDLGRAVARRVREDDGQPFALAARYCLDHAEELECPVGAPANESFD